MQKKKGDVSRLSTGQSALDSVELMLWFANGAKLFEGIQKDSRGRTSANAVYLPCCRWRAITRSGNSKIK